VTLGKKGTQKAFCMTASLRQTPPLHIVFTYFCLSIFSWYPKILLNLSCLLCQH